MQPVWLEERQPRMWAKSPPRLEWSPSGFTQRTLTGAAAAVEDSSGARYPRSPAACWAWARVQKA